MKIFGDLPSHVAYVPIDFGKEKLDDKLFESGYNKDVKTLFIWESVSHLLTENEVDSILSFVAKNSGSGSSIIFDYQFKSVLDGTNEWKGTKGFRKVVKRSDGQPNFGLEGGQVEDFLSQRGFCQVKDVNGEFLKNAYVKEADQSKEFYTLWGIVHATVKPRGVS